jgi:hypothetical protein
MGPVQNDGASFCGAAYYGRGSAWGRRETENLVRSGTKNDGGSNVGGPIAGAACNGARLDGFRGDER